MIRKTCCLIVLFAISLSAQANIDIDSDVNADAQASCTTEDKTHLQPGNHAFAEALYACSGLSGLDEPCFHQNYSGVSKTCIGCYGQMTSCTVNKCMGNCMFSPKGTGCRDCARSKCGDIIETCAGIKRDQSPDFQR
jgi:hypothetical protein